MKVFTVHWNDYVQGRSEFMSPLINTIPVALIAVTAPLGQR